MRTTQTQVALLVALVVVATIGIAGLALWIAAGPWRDGWYAIFTATVGLAVAYQAGMVWRYTRLAPREVQRAERSDPARAISLVVSNVLQTNRAADRLIGALRETDADVVLCVETDDWWHQRLEELRGTHPHTLQCPLPNTYGMLLYSRHPLEETAIDFLVERDVPAVVHLGHRADHRAPRGSGDHHDVGPGGIGCPQDGPGVARVLDTAEHGRQSRLDRQCAEHRLHRLARAPRGRAQHPVGHQALVAQPAPGGLGFVEAGLTGTLALAVTLGGVCTRTIDLVMTMSFTGVVITP